MQWSDMVDSKFLWRHMTQVDTWRRAPWFVAGCVALALGALGVILPLLPTTAFVILAAFCFGKASPRVESWLLNSKLFGPMIADWRARGAIAPRYKVIALTVMVGVLVLSVWLGVSGVVLAVQACAIAAAGAFILTRPNS